MLGIIGGSGLYDLEGLEGAECVTVDTPFGAPSDQIFQGRLGQTEIAFLPRHGRGHVYSPSGINYRANIDAMKRLGVTQIVSVSAVGSMREEIAPGHFVMVDQFIDRTRHRDEHRVVQIEPEHLSLGRHHADDHRDSRRHHGDDQAVAEGRPEPVNAEPLDVPLE